MIKKSFLIFLVLLAIHIIIRDFLIPEVVISQSSSQENHIKAQDYLYSKDNVDNILVGSSMSFHLELDSTKHPITNLSFTGESASKGITLILKRGELLNKYPKRVFIEINTLDYFQSSTFEEAVFNPFFLYLRAHTPSLRDGRQPLPMVATVLQNQIPNYLIPYKYTFLQELLEPKEQDESHYFSKTNVAKRISQDTLQDALIPNERLLTSTLDNEDAQRMESSLAEKINILIDNNCTPIFFEMPVADRHRFSEKYQIIRSVLNKHYNPADFIYIHYPADSNFQTYDGLHLSGKDSPRYSAYLRTMIDSITESSK